MNIEDKINNSIIGYKRNNGENPKYILLDRLDNIKLEYELYDELNYSMGGSPENFPSKEYIKSYKGIPIIDKDKCISI
ncbi:MAG: hypothetical protein WCY33_03350 [Clostridia bacterium]|jgi:hypothetical protein